MEKYSGTWLMYEKPVKPAQYRFIERIVIDKSAFECACDKKQGKIIENAVNELKKVLSALKLDVSVKKKAKAEDSITILCDKSMKKESYRIVRKKTSITITAADASGVLYGAFDLARSLYLATLADDTDRTEVPMNPLRMMNHWDNIDGSIERGYSGLSFFMKDGKVLVDDRTGFYARMAASVGINGVVINNVNVRGDATNLINEKFRKKLQAMQAIFEGYGIKLYLSLNYAAPVEMGDLTTSDPLDKKVRKWWIEKMKEFYEAMPGFGGFLVKADSEGRPGPFTYGRTHADGANMLADAVRPYGGLIIWRCFVYNCQQDWRDRITDRAKAGYDNFMPIDGQFAENVILQIKNGPMDFQVREPISPLFGGLKATNQMLEVQAAQEYTGQQRHICYLVPMWKEVLDFRTGINGKGMDNDRVSDIVSGRTLGHTNCGMAAVANSGDDYNWFGHDFAAANYYGFGRLAWNTELTAEEIANEWARLTYGAGKAADTIVRILMDSYEVYENYTSPLGIGWMVNPNHHYGPNVNGYEFDRWGTYHRADRDGIGVDRTTKGTGYTAQYNEEKFTLYENPETCPEELLLFFHYVRYDKQLKSGKTLIQHIYDTHFEGYESVEGFVRDWKSLKGKVPTDVYTRVEERLQEQLRCAREWRDLVNTYFYRMSGVADAKGRTIY